MTWLLCALALLTSLLIRSAGIALVGGLAAWLAVSWLTDRRAAGGRLRIFLPMVVAAMLAQAAWMHWVAAHEFIEWPIGGYPRSYVSQLSVKSGNDPELGAASLVDIPPRVVKNLTERVTGLVSLLAWPGWINPVWSSPMLAVPLILILIGLGGSLWPSGGRVTEWYFLGHEAMYLLWPWDLEMRFLLPIVPLAGLYLWRGGRRLLGWAARRPRRTGAWTALLALPAATHAGISAWRTESMQLTVAAAFWALLALVGLAAASMHGMRLRAAVERLPWPVLVSALSAAGLLLFTAEVGLGIAREARLGRDNLAFDLTARATYPDVEAGRWLRAHTAESAIVMARQVDVVYHYSGRQVIWFPPISDPGPLMEGIRKYGVQLIVINERTWSYWLPPEEDCFAALARAHPTAFRLVAEGPRFRIFEVIARE